MFFLYKSFVQDVGVDLKHAVLPFWKSQRPQKESLLFSVKTLAMTNLESHTFFKLVKPAHELIVSIFSGYGLRSQGNSRMYSSQCHPLFWRWTHQSDVKNDFTSNEACRRRMTTSKKISSLTCNYSPPINFLKNSTFRHNFCIPIHCFIVKT